MLYIILYFFLHLINGACEHSDLVDVLDGVCQAASASHVFTGKTLRLISYLAKRIKQRPVKIHTLPYYYKQGKNYESEYNLIDVLKSHLVELIKLSLYTQYALDLIV